MSFTNQDIHNAAGPGSSAEPSMEEILASIRRILKEDEPAKPAEPPTAPVEMDEDVLLLDESMIAKPADLFSATTPPIVPTPAGETPPTPLAPAGEPLHFSSEPVPFARDFDHGARATPDPGIDLPTAVADETATDPHPGPQMFGAPTTPPDDETVPAPEAPITSAFPEPTPEPEAAEPPALDEHHEPDFERADEHTPYESRPQYQPDREPPRQYDRSYDDRNEPDNAAQYEPETTHSEPRMNENAPDNSYQPPESLISDQATSAAASSIGALVRSMTNEKSIAISKGSSITIEDIVRDEIRPLLKSWLDTHLPSLVERIVRIEIERVISRSVV
jgi:cell pole-organizing protein PopZ